MSARSKRYRKSRGPFVATPLAIMNTKAWRTMSLGARLLHIQLRCRLRNDGLNNGSIFESCRGAAEKMGVNRNSIAHWYHELEHYGFIRKTTPGFLGGDGRAIASPISPTAHIRPRAIMRRGTERCSTGKNRIPSYQIGHPVLPNRTYGRPMARVLYVLPNRT
jgi:DNA-binding transcriptional MocR family regulator